MLDDPQLDPIGQLIAELKADGDVAALVDDRVRGFEPKGKSGSYEGDALGPGTYKAFVVIAALDVPVHPRLPIVLDGSYVVRCYGSTAQGAWAVWAAVVKALHATRPRRKSNGLGIYRTAVLTGGTQDKDPVTGQPLTEGTIAFIGTAQAIPA